MSWVTKIKNFCKALWFHIGYGLPKCSQQQINKRFLICLDCEFYDLKHKECLQCGCNISPKKKFLNKLAWADQKCPINKWNKEI
jgi:hypothetical protein